MEAAARGEKLFETRGIPPPIAVEIAPRDKLVLIELKSAGVGGFMIISASKPVYVSFRRGEEELKGEKAWFIASSLSEAEMSAYMLPKDALKAMFTRELSPPMPVSKLDVLSFYSDLLEMETGLMVTTAETSLYLFERRGQSTPPIAAYGRGELQDIWSRGALLTLYEVSDPECFITSEELPPPAGVELLSLAKAVPYFPTERDRVRVLSGVDGVSRDILEHVDGKRTCFDIKVETGLPLDLVVGIIDSFNRMGNVRVKR